MKLRPQIGIDDFVFGLSDYKIIRKLGTPDLIEEAWNNYDELVYQYFDLKTSFSFFLSNNRKLGLIRSANKELTFNSNKIIGKTITEVQYKILKLDEKHWEIEPSALSIHYYTHALNIGLNVQYNSVTDVEIHPDFSSPFNCLT